jgi:hypothetical protein
MNNVNQEIIVYPHHLMLCIIVIDLHCKLVYYNNRICNLYYRINCSIEQFVSCRLLLLPCSNHQLFAVIIP